MCLCSCARWCCNICVCFWSILTTSFFFSHGLDVCVWFCPCMNVFLFRCIFSRGVLEYCLCSLRGVYLICVPECSCECWNILFKLLNVVWEFIFPYDYLSSMLWQLTVCLRCYRNLFFLICPPLQVSDSLWWYLLVSLICILPSVNYFVKILEAVPEIYDIPLLVLKIMMWLRIYMWYRVVIWGYVPFFKEDLFCEDWRKGCVCLSSLFGLGSSCFSQKFAKEGDCWIFVCWLHFCLKQIFTLDVEHNVPTSRHGLCVMYLALFKESTPSLVLVNLRVFMRRAEQMWFPKEVLAT